MGAITKTLAACERPHRTDIEVAAYLGVSLSKVRRWRLTGGGPRWIRIGKGSIRYKLADLEAYVAALPSGGGHQTEAQ
jgi:predicted DNA-binding transcriptional regulator AlpA